MSAIVTVFGFVDMFTELQRIAIYVQFSLFSYDINDMNVADDVGVYLPVCGSYLSFA